MHIPIIMLLIHHGSNHLRHRTILSLRLAVRLRVEGGAHRKLRAQALPKRPPEVTREARIPVTEDGRREAVLPDDPVVHHATYQRRVSAAPRRGFVFFRRELGSTPIVGQLERHGYRKHPVGPFVVYAPP